MPSNNTTIGSIAAIGLATGTVAGYTLSPSCPPHLMGDADNSGVVDFADYTAVGANYGRTADPWSPPPSYLPSDILSVWGSNYVLAIYPLSIDGLESPERCAVVLSRSASQACYDLSLSPLFIRGIRGLTWPGGWPMWPPPGSNLELLMQHNADSPETVEATATLILQHMGIISENPAPTPPEETTP